MPSPEEPLYGSCLCGGVRFRVTAPFRRANHCHCSRCQKHSGTGCLTQGRVPKEGFELLAGADLLRSYRKTPEAKAKVFCVACGSSLFGGDWPDGPEVSVRFGALDGDPGLRPEYRSHVASKAPWDELPEDGLELYDGAKPDADSSPSPE